VLKTGLKSHTLLILGAAIAGTTVALAANARAKSIGNERVPEPVKPVDLTRYLGRWHEIARYDASFERGCEAATAEYALRPDGLISVVNSCREGSPTGRFRSASAKATVVPGSHGAKLKVSFFGSFFRGDYWVLDHGDDYEWSIVGEPRGRYLWLLHRHAKPATETINMLDERASQLGYDTTRLHMTQQPA
jgi:apolipoprotein D and lipocalin family protein